MFFSMFDFAFWTTSSQDASLIDGLKNADIEDLQRQQTETASSVEHLFSEVFEIFEIFDQKHSLALHFSKSANEVLLDYIFSEGRCKSWHHSCCSLYQALHSPFCTCKKLQYALLLEIFYSKYTCCIARVS